LITTELEREILDLAIQWVDAKYAVEEALIRQEFVRKIRMLKKERRDAKCQESQNNTASGE
jgi:hypothetical protein